MWCLEQGWSSWGLCPFTCVGCQVQPGWFPGSPPYRAHTCLTWSPLTFTGLGSLSFSKTFLPLNPYSFITWYLCGGPKAPPCRDAPVPPPR